MIIHKNLLIHRKLLTSVQIKLSLSLLLLKLMSSHSLKHNKRVRLTKNLFSRHISTLIKMIFKIQLKKHKPKLIRNKMKASTIPKTQINLTKTHKEQTVTKKRKRRRKIKSSNPSRILNKIIYWRVVNSLT